jgi:hypothetical protein
MIGSRASRSALVHEADVLGTFTVVYHSGRARHGEKILTGPASGLNLSLLEIPSARSRDHTQHVHALAFQDDER